MKNVAKILTGKDKKLSFYKVEVQAEDDEEEEKEDGLDKEEDKDSVASELSFQLPSDTDNEDEDGSDLDETDALKFDEYKMLDEEREERPKKNREQSMGKIRKTEVDDEFFKVGEMEKFLEKEEAEKPIKDDDEDSIDYFEEVFSDDEDINVFTLYYFLNYDCSIICVNCFLKGSCRQSQVQRFFSRISSCRRTTIRNERGRR